MKKLICAFTLVLGFIFGTSSAFAGECPNVIFYGKTVNQKKEVFVCLVSPGKLYYSFGKVGVPKPELSVWATPATSSWATNYGSVVSVTEVNIKNGDYTYTVGYGHDDSNKPFASVDVYKGYKLLTTINLDTNKYIGNISDLRESDIPETDEL